MLRFDFILGKVAPMNFKRRIGIVLALLVTNSTIGLSALLAQNSDQATTNDNQVRSAGEWLEFRQARFVGRPILLHLRSGFERAVIMPEPIKLLNQAQILPGCAVEIDTDVVGFFPTHTFTRTPIRFKGLATGTIYELRVRASAAGIIEPLQITR